MNNLMSRCTTNRINLRSGESKVEYEKWKQFLENITVEWLISNYSEKDEHGDISTTPCGPDHISTRDYDWLVYCGTEVRYYFNTPSDLRKLKFAEDKSLIGHLPLDAWEDFIRVMEL